MTLFSNDIGCSSRKDCPKCKTIHLCDSIKCSDPMQDHKEKKYYYISEPCCEAMPQCHVCGYVLNGLGRTLNTRIFDYIDKAFDNNILMFDNNSTQNFHINHRLVSLMSSVYNREYDDHLHTLWIDRFCTYEEAEMYDRIGGLKVCPADFDMTKYFLAIDGHLPLGKHRICVGQGTKTTILGAC